MSNQPIRKHGRTQFYIEGEGLTPDAMPSPRLRTIAPAAVAAVGRWGLMGAITYEHDVRGWPLRALIGGAIVAVVSALIARGGDVPGWVMVTVMSAILVVALLAVFEPQIKDAVSGAIDSVTGSK